MLTIAIIQAAWDLRLLMEIWPIAIGLDIAKQFVDKLVHILFTLSTGITFKVLEEVPGSEYDFGRTDWLKIPDSPQERLRSTSLKLAEYFPGREARNFGKKEKLSPVPIA